MRPRRNRPLFIIDIALPRDVEAGGRRNRTGVPLQHRRSAGDGRARTSRGARAKWTRAEAIVAEEVEKFGGWLRSRGAIPTVVALRQRFETIRRAELERLDFKLSALPPEARARVDEVTRLIVEKLLLTPTEQLKALGDPDTVGAYSEALTRLFGLGEDRRSRRRPAKTMPAGATDRPGRAVRASEDTRPAN